MSSHVRSGYALTTFEPFHNIINYIDFLLLDFFSGECDLLRFFLLLDLLFFFLSLFIFLSAGGMEIPKAFSIANRSFSLMSDFSRAIKSFASAVLDLFHQSTLRRSPKRPTLHGHFELVIEQLKRVVLTVP